MWPFNRRGRKATAYRELPANLRAGGMALLWFSALPLLLSLPGQVAIVVWLIPGGAGVLSLIRPVHRLTLAALMGVAILAIFTIQSGSGDIRATGLGLLVAVLLMKAAEMRTTRDGYSTIGFSLICPFVAFVMDVGVGWTTVVAVICLVGTMVLAGMLTEWQDRRPVKHWGRHLRRVGLLAVLAFPVAAISFWVVPRLDAPMWGMAGESQAQSGVGDTMAPGDVSNLLRDPSTAFRVEFEGPTPTESMLYWRGMTLGHFDGRTWTATPLRTGGETQPDTQAMTQAKGGPSWSYTITMEPSRRRTFFVLEHLVGQAGSSGYVLADNTVRARAPINRVTVLEKMTASSNASLEEEGLNDLDWQAYTQLPEGFNPQAVALAKSWQEEGLQGQAIVNRALSLLGDGFTYSLRPPLLGRNSVDEFLFETRVGYCEHYSSSFATLMRAAGIPTRVVLGYQGGEENQWGGYWRVRQADAHAWNEVWLERQGWVRVDPTASVGEREPGEGQRQNLFRSLGGNGAFADWLRQSWGSAFRDFDANKQRAMLDKVGLKGIHPVVGMALAGGALLLVFGAIALSLMRERTGQEEPELKAWRVLLKRLERAGFNTERSETPLDMARRVGDMMADPLHSQELTTLAKEFCAWRYENKIIPGLVGKLRTFKPRKSRA